jgi:protein-S-isoprenylcysteine O-methyltransferase Ste14
MVGLFMVLPSAISFLIVVTGWVVMQIQIRLEEEYLLKVHGTHYQKYLNRVRRWL